MLLKTCPACNSTDLLRFARMFGAEAYDIVECKRCRSWHPLDVWQSNFARCMGYGLVGEG